MSMQPKLLPKEGLDGLTENWRSDLLSGFLVFLIALPLCLGIAIASGFPPGAGIITAIIGGLIVSHINGSYVTINGPAAGLIVVVFNAVQTLGEGDAIAGYRYTLAAIMLAGALQFFMGLNRAGQLSAFGRQGPGPQFTGTRQPVRRDRLDRTAGPVCGDAEQSGVNRGTHQGVVVLGPGRLGLQASRGHHVGQCGGPPLGLDHHRESGSLPDRHHLAGRCEHPGEIGDRGGHRLGREERQLAHDSTVGQSMALSALPGPSGTTGNDSTPSRPGVRAPRGCSSESVSLQTESRRLSDGANAGGLGPLGALAYLKLHLLVLLQGAEARTLNLRVVDENIGGAVLRSDEAEALLRVEPLHSSLWHFSYFPSFPGAIYPCST